MGLGCSLGAWSPYVLPSVVWVLWEADAKVELDAKSYQEIS